MVSIVLAAVGIDRFLLWGLGLDLLRCSFRGVRLDGSILILEQIEPLVVVLVSLAVLLDTLGIEELIAILFFVAVSLHLLIGAALRGLVLEAPLMQQAADIFVLVVARGALHAQIIDAFLLIEILRLISVTLYLIEIGCLR